MAYIVPPTFTPGAILTAAQMTILGNDILAGGPIYATEAARDAAIPSPFKGQRAYITGTTVATATGLVTAIPTGIQCIHNGSSTPTLAANWVCVTPVGADTASGGTLTSAAATLYSAAFTSGGGTNPSVTLTTGTTALVLFGVTSSVGTTGIGGFCSVAVSGATTSAATDDRSISGEIANYTLQGTSLVFTGLTAGINTFTLNYRINNATTMIVLRRRLVVQGIA